MSSNLWLQRSTASDVEVYVDWMNLYLAGRNVFDGLTDVHAHLHHLWEMAMTVGKNPSRVYIYLNVTMFRKNHPSDCLKLLSECRKMNFFIVDVPLVDGKDQVDPWMIEVMTRRNHTVDVRVPFLFVSADRGFAPMLAEIRQNRKIFIGLPTTPKIPLLSKATSGWNWIHPRAWRHVAVYDAMHPTEISSECRVNNLVETRHEYCLGLALAQRCLANIRQQDAFVSNSAIEAFVADAIKPFAWRNDNEENVFLLSGALFHYEVIRRCGRGLVISADHRAVKKEPNKKPSRYRRSAV